MKLFGPIKRGIKESARRSTGQLAKPLTETKVLNLMLVDYPVSATPEYTKTDPNEYSFGENSAEYSGHLDSPARGRADLPQQKRKKSTSISTSISTVFDPKDPKGHLKPPLQIIPLKQRSSSNEKSLPSPTLDKIFGGNFKVVDVFTGSRDSSEEHFPEDPLTRRLSPRKQENFEIVEADEEDEDFKESRKGNRQIMHKHAMNSNGAKPILKASSNAQLNTQKAQPFDYPFPKKTPFFDEKEASFRLSQKKFFPRQPEETKSNSSKNLFNDSQLLQGTIQVEASVLTQRKAVNHSKSRSKLEGTFNYQNNSFHAKHTIKNSESYVVLPPLNLTSESAEQKSLGNRGRTEKRKNFFNTQTQFLLSGFDSQILSPRGQIDVLEPKRTERENKFVVASPVVNAEFRDDGMNLFEKYADRFQLNLEELGSKKYKSNKHVSPERLGLVPSIRISTPYKSFQAEVKNPGSISVRGLYGKKPKLF